MNSLGSDLEAIVTNIIIDDERIISLIKKTLKKIKKSRRERKVRETTVIEFEIRDVIAAIIKYLYYIINRSTALKDEVS